jgi:hypothetical protein
VWRGTVVIPGAPLLPLVLFTGITEATYGKINIKCKEVFEKLNGSRSRACVGGPHLAATWGDYIRNLGIVNLASNNKIDLLCDIANAGCSPCRQEMQGQGNSRNSVLR